MSGPPPKPAHLRQRTNKKAGATVLQHSASPDVPELPNPDGRTFHQLTLKQWSRAWGSPMASQWLQTDADALGRLALLWDNWNREPGDVRIAAEIRQEQQLFGFTPLDRSRLQWEVAKGEEAEHRLKSGKPVVKRASSGDPRAFLKGLK